MNFFMIIKTNHKKRIQAAIQDWYKLHQRRLPWRISPDPYHIWISEIMLQQTQVETVIPYYRRFIKQFPTVSSLANASLEEVLKVWENLGYYGRARHLHAAARKIVWEMEGKIPETRGELLCLPGIGTYTASAILSFAYHRPVAAVDGNVKRVLARLLFIREPLEKTGTIKKIEKMAQMLVNGTDSSGFNQGLMDLGAGVCRPLNPACPSCPLAEFCRAGKEGLQEKVPVKKGKGPLPHKDFTAGVLMDHQDRLLIIRRPARGLLGGLWKLPGGERKDGAPLKSSLASILAAELGVPVCVDKKLISVKHAYTHFRITLHVFSCRPVHGRSIPGGDDSRIWSAIGDLKNYPFSKADRKIIERMISMGKDGSEKEYKG